MCVRYHSTSLSVSSVPKAKSVSDTEKKERKIKRETRREAQIGYEREVEGRNYVLRSAIIKTKMVICVQHLQIGANGEETITQVIPWQFACVPDLCLYVYIWVGAVHKLVRKCV